MSKIVIPEFDACHKFSEKIRREIPIEQREKCNFTHNVSYKEFSVFIGFTSVCFDIDVLLLKITEEAKKSDLSSLRWKTHRPILHRSKYMKLSPDDFEHEVVLTFVVNKQKKNGLFLVFLRALQGEFTNKKLHH